MTTKSEIPCLITPLINHNLVFPSNLMAEVILLDEIESAEDTKICGWIRWRNRRIPLIRLENICESIPIDKPPRRAVVLHTLLQNKQIPFIAVGTDGIPHNVNIREDMLMMDDGVKHNDSEAGNSDFIASKVRVANLSCIIPDWPKIEGAVSGALHLNP